MLQVWVVSGRLLYCQTIQNSLKANGSTCSNFSISLIQVLLLLQILLCILQIKQQEVVLTGCLIDSVDYYSFKCVSPSGQRRYLCANPTASKEESVRLTETNASVNMCILEYSVDPLYWRLSAMYHQCCLSPVY